MVDEIEERDTRLSPTEMYYYYRYLKKPDSKALLMSKEVHFHDLELGHDEVVELFKLLISLHPIAHTGFETVTDNVTKQKVARRKILEINEALDCHVILNLRDKTMIDSPNIRTFDLQKHSPVKFAFSTKPYLIIRFIFHRVGFDYKAVAIFVKDFILMLKRLGLKDKIPNLKCGHSRQAFHDLDRYLTSNFVPLGNFWLKKLKIGITKTSFTTSSKQISFRKHEEDFHYSYLSFTPSTSRNIKELTTRNGISMLNLFVSVYQLLLSFFSKKEYVTVLTETDMRQKITGADYLVESMINMVPLTAKIPIKKDQQILEFLSENESTIKNYLSMAAFPFSDICDILKTTDRKNILRHKIVERLPEVKTDNVISEGKIRDLGMVHETSLEFSYDTKRSILNLQLQASSDTYSETEAIGILENIAKILRLVSSRSDVSINQLRHYIIENKLSLDLFDRFIKMGDNDNQDVLLSLTDDNGDNTPTLKWSKTGSKQVNLIDLKTISNVHLISVSDSKGLWMKTSTGEEHKFIFRNTEHINDWIDRLESILNYQIIQL